MPSVQNAIVMVTGGAFGIGRALCEQLARSGNTVVIADINSEQAEVVAAAIRQSGGEAEAFHVDVSSEPDVQRLVEHTAAAYGRLDYLFNNAALAIVGEMRDGNLADFRRVIDVNLFGVVHGTMAAYKVMRQQRSGHIVNVSSVVGFMPIPILAAYSTSKAAITAFSMAIRQEAAVFGVDVSVACLGLVRTTMGERNLYWNVRKEDHLAQLPLRWASSPAHAAAGILRGVTRHQEMILWPFSSRLAWWAHRAAPGLFTGLMRRSLERFRTLRINQ